MTRNDISPAPAFSFHPLDGKRWRDLEKLFGERGGCGGCWCMAWRLKPSEFRRQKGAGNRAALKKLVGNDEAVGILAYRDGEPVGWCAVAPREKYPRLENSRVWKRIDDQPVWSVTCLFIARPWRRKGFSVKLIGGAVEFCRSRGAEIVEAYPVVPYADRIPDAFAWTGTLSAFEKAGFQVAARRSSAKPLMRLYL